MDHDRISSIRIEGMRCLEDVSLGLGDLTVLIGANGSGKSSIVEACEIVRKAGTERSFVRRLYEDHGGPAALLRRTGSTLGFTVDVTLASPYHAELPLQTLRYRFTLRAVQPFTLTITSESVVGISTDGRTRHRLMSRDTVGYTAFDPRSGQPVGPDHRPVDGDELALPQLRSSILFEQVFARLNRALESIEVHPPPDVRPRWLAGSNVGARAENVVRSVARVEPGGSNLANLYFALSNGATYRQVLEEVQLGLGSEVEDVVIEASPAGGQIALGLRVRGVGVVPAYALSDGQLAYLLQVAIVNLRRAHPPSLLVLDEPDLHAHPGLAVRIAGLMETAATSFPVLATTQSDIVLDALTSPDETVVLCERDADLATVLRRADPAELQSWLERHRGVGELRRLGYERLAFDRLQSRAADGS